MKSLTKAIQTWACHNFLSISPQSLSFAGSVTGCNGSITFRSNPFRRQFSSPRSSSPAYSSPDPSQSEPHLLHFNVPTHVETGGGELLGYFMGKARATTAAHMIWSYILKKGDTAIDATCGNGNDTLALLKMVADESGTGCVFGIDIQQDAIIKTSAFLDASLTPEKRQAVKLFHMCHSRMEAIVPADGSVRLVAFNLGYLPKGDKSITTMSRTTLQALEAASRLLVPGGLISIIVYVGHPGGREELETVETFASGLPVDNWVCSKFQMLNRPLAPLALFIFRR